MGEKPVRFCIARENRGSKVDVMAKSHLGAMAAFLAEVANSDLLRELEMNGEIFYVCLAARKTDRLAFIVHPIYAADNPTGFTVRRFQPLDRKDAADA